jgi:hypothetical protein
MANFCTSCGTSNLKNQKFCTNCGYKVSEGSSEQILSQITQKGSKGINLNFRIIGIIAILVVFSGIFFYNTKSQVSTTSSLKNTAKQPIKKSSEGKEEKGLSILKEVEFYNKSNKKIYLALGYMDLSNKWKSEGYFPIDSHESYFHSYKSKSSQIYWYADGINNGADWWEIYRARKFCVNKNDNFEILKSENRSDLCGKNEILQGFYVHNLTSQKNTILRLFTKGTVL